MSTSVSQAWRAAWLRRAVGLLRPVKTISYECYRAAALRGPLSANRFFRVPGEVGLKFIVHGNWSHARTTATMWNAKRFMQVEMTYIGAHVTGSAETDLRIHVGTVHINEPTAFMDDLTDFLNSSFKYTVS